MVKKFATLLLFEYFYKLMKWKINWDALGIGTSLACAIHCALLPLFLNSLPLFGMNIIEDAGFEMAMIVLAFFIGGISLYHGYRKHHHSHLPILLFVLGFLLLLSKQFFHAIEVWLLIPAVILIITAHIINYRNCKVHAHAHHDDCDH